MIYKFGDIVITNDNKIGIITQVIEVMKQYVVSFPTGSMLYGFEIERKFYTMAKDKMLKNIPIYKTMNLEYAPIKESELEQMNIFDYIEE